MCNMKRQKMRKRVEISVLDMETMRKTKKTLNKQHYLKDCFVVSEKVANFASCLE